MKHLAIFPVVVLFLSAGVVKSQAPVTGTVLSNLQGMEAANKAMIEKQEKTLQLLDQLGENARQLKIFAGRS
jgi:hypothetical protein